MKNKSIIITILVFFIFLYLASADLPTKFGVHGSVNISEGDTNLTVTVSRESDCTLPFYNYTFINNVSNASFFVTVGLDEHEQINLSYRTDYFLQLFVNNTVVNFKNAGTCFLAQLGQGEIGQEDVNFTEIQNNITLNEGYHFIGLIDCTNITGGSDADFCADAEGAGGADTFSANLTQGIPGDLTPYTNLGFSIGNTTNYWQFVLAQVINSTDWGNVTITESQISDLSHTTDTNATTECATGEHLDGGGNCLDTNSTIDDRTASTTYYPALISVLGGTLLTGNYTSLYVAKEDDQNVTVQEDAGATPVLDIYINFTGVTDFNSIIMREWYDAPGSSHEIAIGLFDFSDGEWEEEYGNLNPASDFAFSNINVLDASNHIDSGIVPLRLRHIQTGISSHLFSLDYAVLVDGFSTTVNTEHDALTGRDDINNHPWAASTNGLRNFTTIFSLDWSNITLLEAQIPTLTSYVEVAGDTMTGNLLGSESINATFYKFSSNETTIYGNSTNPLYVEQTGEGSICAALRKGTTGITLDCTGDVLGLGSGGYNALNLRSQAANQLTLETNGNININDEWLINVDTITASDNDKKLDLDAAADAMHFRVGGGATDNYIILYSESTGEESPAIYPSSTGEGQLGVTSLRWDTLWAEKIGNEISMESNKITSVADPTAAQDAATKNYVDSMGNCSVGGSCVDVAYLGHNNTGNFNVSYQYNVTMANSTFYDNGTCSIWVRGETEIGICD